MNIVKEITTPYEHCQRDEEGINIVKEITRKNIKKLFGILLSK